MVYGRKGLLWLREKRWQQKGNRDAEEMDKEDPSAEGYAPDDFHAAANRPNGKAQSRRADDSRSETAALPAT